MKKSQRNSLNKINETELLALISSASVTRDESHFRMLIEIYFKQNYDNQKIYEAVLQTYLFAGFPSALISLRILSEYLDATDFKTDKRSLQKIIIDGVANCRKIYGSAFEKLISNIDSFSPELSRWLISEGYGKVLSRNGITLKERELLIISILASLKFDEQLFSHIRGSIRLGNSFTTIQKIFRNLKLIGQIDSFEFGKAQLKRVRFKQDLNKA